MEIDDDTVRRLTTSVRLERATTSNRSSSAHAPELRAFWFMSTVAVLIVLAVSIAAKV